MKCARRGNWCRLSGPTFTPIRRPQSRSEIVHLSTPAFGFALKEGLDIGEGWDVRAGIKRKAPPEYGSHLRIPLVRVV
jgi:hypothetical protein